MAREEEKLAWRALPRTVRREVERALGSEVARGWRVWGGYAPSVTLRLQLVDGRPAFLKASPPGSTEFMRSALQVEERVYRELAPVLREWAPALLGSVQLDGWHCLLLEDLGPASVPPWTVTRARQIAEQYGAFHASTLGRALPDWLPRGEHANLARGWDTLAADEECLPSLVALAGDRAREARAWLDAALPALTEAAQPIAEAGQPGALLHLDTRSDNLRLVDGRLRIFDWPSVAVGPPELDLAAFAQSVPGEGGPPAQRMAEWYSARLPVREEMLTGCVSAVAAFFAQRAWLRPIEGLPRLRGVQRRQLKMSLRWAAERLRLPDPAWVDAVAS